MSSHQRPVADRPREHLARWAQRHAPFLGAAAVASLTLLVLGWLTFVDVPPVRLELRQESDGQWVVWDVPIAETAWLAGVKPGMTVLCLGARQGTEVEVFLELGCFALGIDLNPGPQNPHVVYGDFHEIGFPAGSADVIYSNSLDHALDIDRVIAGIRRVLKPDGLLVIEAVRGREEGQAPRFYESFFWSRIDDLVALLQRHGFRLLVRAPFSEPWAGDHLCFRGSS